VDQLISATMDKAMKVLPWLVVAILGGFVGTAELMSRYRDAPVGAVRTRPALFYIAINIFASLGALTLAKLFGWKFNFGDPNNATAAEWSLVILCGVSAMALFRSSLFIRKVGDREVGIGPSSFLQIFLSAADAEVDRHRAVYRSNIVAVIMKDVDYGKAAKVLPPYCIALMQSLADDVQRDLRKAVELLDQADMDPDLKARTLGLELVNVFGVPVLEQAVKSLSDQIRREALNR
jgi:hypothetical protein